MSKDRGKFYNEAYRNGLLLSIRTTQERQATFTLKMKELQAQRDMLDNQIFACNEVVLNLSQKYSELQRQLKEWDDAHPITQKSSRKDAK
jgi:hypothetical protein